LVAVVTASVLVILGSVGGLVTGVAHADCTTPGDFGASAGCAPPDDSSGSGKAEAWPPTAVDWPPKQDSDTGSTGRGGADASTPIVLPDGQKPRATPASGTTSTAASAAPIVPVGVPSTGSGGSSSTSATPIVMPTVTTHG
jgi:hypothetical protein